MSVLDWSTNPDENTEQPGIWLYDRAQTKNIYPRSVRQIMADIAAWAVADGIWLNAADYGAVGDDSFVNTTELQTAIDAAMTTGKPLWVPPGVYRTNALVVPAGRVSIYMAPGAELKAQTAGITVLSFADDAGRLNQKLLSGGVINGNNLANVIGIGFDGIATNALLYTRVNDTYIKNCYEGFAGRNVQELILDGVICYSNTIGGTIESTAIGGGGTVLGFRNCRFQDNTVGFLGISSSVFPIGGWLFEQCTFQSNLINGMSLFGATGGNAQLTAIQVVNGHFEGNGASGTATIVVRGKTIKRSGIYAVGASVFMDGCEAGESITAVTSQLLETNAVLELQSCTLGGGTKIQVNADSTSIVLFTGNTLTTGNSTGIVEWSGLAYRISNGAGGGLRGTPLVVAGNQGRNLYYNAAGLPDTPEAVGIIGATASKVFDAEQGWVQQVAYLAAVGSFGANRIAFDAIAGTTAANGAIAVSILVYSATATTAVFTINGSGVTISTNVILVIGWQRVVVYTLSSASAAATEFLVWPLAADGPTLKFAKIMVDYVAPGSNESPITNMIRFGLYDNMRPILTAAAIPTAGTFARGTKIINSAPAVGAARGWTKVTTGAANVLGVDWINEGNL